jgi:hypothetical protein
MKKNIVALLLAAALLISMVGVASASIKWDLDSGTPLIMWKPAHGESGAVSFTDGNSKVWRADEDAKPAGGVYFPPDQWQGRLTTNEDLAGMYTVDIGYSNSGGSGFVSNGNTGSQSSYDALVGASNFKIAAAEFTVPQGKYLAFKVTASGASFDVDTDGSSYVMWPSFDPDYPYPELSTLVLLSVGLLTLIGYVGLRRRRNNKSK